jgi:hypothetical protein
MNLALDIGLSVPHLKDATGTCLDFNDNTVLFEDGFFQGEVNVRDCKDASYHHERGTSQQRTHEYVYVHEPIMARK